MENKVKDQYLKFPYPQRNPENEKKELVYVKIADIELINNIIWGGKKLIDKNFRVLDAGCGTGDATVYIANELKGTEAEIIALDFSNSSLDVAKRRAEVRDLKNIKFICDSIFNIPNLNLGKFDFIICTGVLHHLEDPEKGLNILTNVLKNNGGMAIMLYGKYGRVPIYIIQDLLKKILKEEDDREKISIARELINGLPKSHWWKLSENSFKDWKTDNGLYDSFLHSSDKPYSIPEIYNLLEKTSLKMIRFSDPGLYSPHIYTKGKILKKIEKGTQQEQEAIAELLCGRIKKHLFFVTQIENKIENTDSRNTKLIPIYWKNKIPENIKEGEILEINKYYYKIKLLLNKKNMAILKLIDGKKNIKDILELASKETNFPHEELFEEWIKLYGLIKHTDLILLNLP